MNLGNHGAKLNAFLTLAMLTLVAAILYFAKAVFVPIALTALLSFLLAPLVARLMRWGLPRAVAVITSVAFAFSIIGVIGWLVTSQTVHLIDRLPEYQNNLQAKISSLKRPHAPGFITRANKMVKELKRELDTNNKEPGPPPDLPADDGTPKPIPVEVKPAKPTSFQLARSVFGPILGPLGTLGIAVVLTIMVLFQREDLRDRFIKLVSGGDLNVATQAVDDAAQRISRYLTTTLLLNAMYGVPVGIALYFIGVPNALLWGLLCTLLRFIPYLGPWIAAAFPITLSIAADPGWTMFFLTAGLFVVDETISNNFLEPWLYGHTTGVSNVALVAAAIFWTWLWGPVGLFLSTPLTVCLMVMGKYVPGLEFLSILLGSQPVLEPHARFYQRMLARDEEEMLDLALEYRTQYSIEDFYDQILVPALIMAEEDRHNGTLAEVRQKFIIEGTRELIQDLAEEDAATVPKGDPIICIPARDDADELAGLMLQHILARRGVAMKVLSVASLPAESGASIRYEGARTVCVSALPPAAVIPARNVCKRLKQHQRNLKVTVGVWTPKAAPADLNKRLAPWADLVVTRLKDAAEEFAPVQPQTLTAPDVEFHLEAAEPEEARDVVVRELAKTFDVPVSLVSVVDHDKEFWAPRLRASAEPDNGREDTLCSQFESLKDAVVVEDVSKDPKFADNNFLEERGVKFLASAPLQLPDGHSVGSLCVMDTKPHTVTEREKVLLAKVAQEFMRVLTHRRLQAA
ncbi:MAG TPA: AI-2E family transporter [Verrucomicrobiae bacterium]|nr:AI-2E family transporter [Verrucomicrobiae bacterium]